MSRENRNYGGALGRAICQDGYMLGSNGARKSGYSWAVFHVIIPCNCRYMALPNKELKRGKKENGRKEKGKKGGNLTQLPRDAKNQFDTINSYAYCVRRPTPAALPRSLTSAFCTIFLLREPVFSLRLPRARDAGRLGRE